MDRSDIALCTAWLAGQITHMVVVVQNAKISIEDPYAISAEVDTRGKLRWSTASHTQVHLARSRAEAELVVATQISDHFDDMMYADDANFESFQRRHRIEWLCKAAEHYDVRLSDEILAYITKRRLQVKEWQLVLVRGQVEEAQAKLSELLVELACSQDAWGSEVSREAV